MEKLFALLKGEKIENKGYIICEDLYKLERIWNANWKTGGNVPYEALTQLADAYSIYVERPDLGFLFCWEAINNSYNELLMKSSHYNRLQDTTGLAELLKNIYSDSSLYKPYLQKYIDNIPLKSCKYVASYVLKGYILDQNHKKSKFSSSSYGSFKTNFKDFHNSIAQSYGQKAVSLASVIQRPTKVEVNIDQNQYRKMVHSLATKIREVLTTGTTQMQSLVLCQEKVQVKNDFSLEPASC